MTSTTFDHGELEVVLLCYMAPDCFVRNVDTYEKRLHVMACIIEWLTWQELQGADLPGIDWNYARDSVHDLIASDEYIPAVRNDLLRIEDALAPLGKSAFQTVYESSNMP
jgi:hypothetical protein